MQLMTWTMARLGSRFSLLFEPYRRRVMHSGLGRFLDEPLDLMVGMIEPDGTERVMPFCQEGVLLHNLEQFERANSITFRGFSERYRLQFELNIHSPFYPQHEAICLMPAFYMELRLNPVDRVRWYDAAATPPQECRLFIRLRRDNTQITTTAECGEDEPGYSAINLSYENRLVPARYKAEMTAAQNQGGPMASVSERLVSLNPGCEVSADGNGLELDLPITAMGSGVKWRLVWASYCDDPVMSVAPGGGSADPRPARLRYRRWWDDLDAVVEQAVVMRDDWLAHSRRFEKLFDQMSLSWPGRHLFNQSFGAFLSNTFWCELDNVEDKASGVEQWFSVWEGAALLHSTLDVEYNASLFYLTLWPRLLGMQLHQWSQFTREHSASGGRYLGHDLGQGLSVGGEGFKLDLPVEENCDFLLLHQAYAHWTGDVTLANVQASTIAALARYLLWSDREECGYVSISSYASGEEVGPVRRDVPRQTHLAVKRLAALQAAADLLRRHGSTQFQAFADQCESVVESALPKIEQTAWLGDHYALCVANGTLGTGATASSASNVASVGGLAGVSEQLNDTELLPGHDAYSIYTANSLLLPMMIGQPSVLDPDHLAEDAVNALRETLGPYGCDHTTAEPNNHVWISQNLWRDHVSRYLKVHQPDLAPRYWDMQVMSNTHGQSLGYVDTYISNSLSFYPRGITAIGSVLAMPRLVIDRLAPGGQLLAVDPDRDRAQRWPLLPLADWQGGKIPVCVVDAQGEVTIEGEIDPVIIRGQQEAEMIG